MSISRTLPPAIVKPITDSTRPSGKARHDADVAVHEDHLTGQPELRERRGLCHHRLGPRTRRDIPFAAPPSARNTISGSSTATSASKSPCWTAARNASTTRRCFAGPPPRWAPAPGPAGGRGSRAGAWPRSSDPRSARSLEGHAEDIVQHERQPFRRLQLLEDHEQRQTDGVGEHGVGLRPRISTAVRASDDRIRHVHVQGILPARRSGAQHVQAHARHDRREPSPQVVDTAHIGAAQTDPGFLDGVLRLADRAEHAIRHRPHVRPVCFEKLRKPLRCRHQSHSLRRAPSL
jgi:hypothetical protein